MTIDATSLDSLRWYRQPWPWLLIAGPATVVVASFATLWLAASTDDGVIADDYYRRGLLINREIARTERAQAMRLGAVLRVAPDGAATLALTGLADSDAVPETVRVYVSHPTRAGRDRVFTLVRGRGGFYVGSITPRPAGRWLVAVETDSWKLQAVSVVEGLGEVRIGASRTTE
jgi:uncharacterized protein